VASCGSDNRVRIWDIEKGVQTAMSDAFEQDIRAIDWSPNGDIIVAADMNAILYILDVSNGKVLDKFASKISAMNAKS
jgi:WD40 repeat protein